MTIVSTRGARELPPAIAMRLGPGGGVLCLSLAETRALYAWQSCPRCSIVRSARSVRSSSSPWTLASPMDAAVNAVTVLDSLFACDSFVLPARARTAGSVTAATFSAHPAARNCGRWARPAQCWLGRWLPSSPSVSQCSTREHAAELDPRIAVYG